MSLNDKLISKGVSRRDFMKLCTMVTATFGVSNALAPKVAEAAEGAVSKPPVIWLEAQDCAGCSTSMLSAINPSPGELILDMISLRYHETVMAAAGHQAEEAMQETIKKGGYVLVVEGSIPTADDRFCVIGGKNFIETFREAAAGAAAIIALGACATYGGFVKVGPTKGVGVAEIIKDDPNLKDKPVINIPGCPAKPAWLIAVILHYITFGTVPELDADLRPKAFFSTLLHDNCPRRGHFENGNFTTDWNDPEQTKWCLLLMGCKGPKTFTDCAQVWWNDGANFCINAGSPCAGCTQKEFYGDFTPLYEKQDMFKMPGLGGIDADKAGKVLGGAAAVAVGAHLAASVATGRIGKKQDHGDAEGKGKEGRK